MSGPDYEITLRIRLTAPTKQAAEKRMGALLVRALELPDVRRIVQESVLPVVRREEEHD